MSLTERSCSTAHSADTQDPASLFLIPPRPARWMWGRGGGRHQGPDGARLWGCGTKRHTQGLRMTETPPLPPAPDPRAQSCGVAGHTLWGLEGRVLPASTLTSGHAEPRVPWHPDLRLHLPCPCVHAKPLLLRTVTALRPDQVHCDLLVTRLHRRRPRVRGPSRARFQNGSRGAV